jgi:DNA-binding transcriptional regulator YdaS (Cro superfamily)
MTRRSIQQHLKQLVHDVGDQKTAATQIGVSPTYLSEVIRGTKPPGPKILKAIGFRRVEAYEKA